jgi:protein-tyrosine phosphatase
MGNFYGLRCAAGGKVNFKAVKTSALLCLLFMAVYGGTNWLTALRHNVGTFYFEWERHIPFVPVMIVPYMSIDLFFIAAPFLCRDDRERRTLSNRIIAAILIAGCCFLLIPLRFAFPRPHVDGPLGIIFNNFRNFDQPFNQLPSLHIALQVILLELYARHTRDMTRGTVRVWFFLIGISTLLTYQHHVIDVIGGAALGALCIHFFQAEPLRQSMVRNNRVGLYYSLGAALLAGMAIFLRPWGLLLLWPTISLGLIAVGYFHVGAGIFRKRDGRLPFLTHILLWPVLLGQRISLSHYARQSNPWDCVTGSLWIGRKLSSREARQAIDQGVTAVLDLTGEFSEAPPFLRTVYRQLPIMDLTAPTTVQLDQAVDFISEQAEQGIVYVHCKVGYSRTAAIAGAYLLATGEAQSVEEVVAILRRARPRIIIRPEVIRALHEYFEQLPASVSASFAFAGAPSPR